MNLDIQTPPERLVLYAVHVGARAMRHLTTVLESHVNQEYSFKLSDEDATSLVERIDTLVQSEIVLIDQVLAAINQQAILMAVRRFAECWLANINKHKQIIDTNSAWHDSVTSSESEIKLLMEISNVGIPSAMVAPASRSETGGAIA